MGVCEGSKQNEIKRINYDEEFICKEKILIPIELVKRMEKSICKIKYKDHKGTGFFMEYNYNYYLITNYHVVSDNIENLEIQIWNKCIVKLDLNKRNIIFLPKPKI